MFFDKYPMNWVMSPPIMRPTKVTQPSLVNRYTTMNIAFRVSKMSVR